MCALRPGAVRAILTMLCCTVVVAAAPPPGIDYQERYARGVTFAQFLAHARSMRREWRAHYNDAAVTADMVTRMRALPERRRLLVVAEDWCADSVNTVPYLARLVDAAPERLAIRIVTSKVGRQIMQAYPTPDGRSATPTVVILGEDDAVVGAWTERPAALRAWLEQQQRAPGTPLKRKALHDRAMQWYADDAGKSTVSDVAAILGR